MKRFLWPGVFSLLLLACIGVLWVHRTVAQQLRLPDGTVVTLDAVTYGTKHRAPLRPGQWWRNMLPFLNHPHYAPLQTSRPSLVFWLSNRQCGKQKPLWEPVISFCCGPPLYHVDVSDERGHHVRLGKAWNCGYNGYILELDSFPCRGKTILVQFPGNPPGSRLTFADQPDGRLTAPNPTSGPFPHWSPAPLPQTRGSENLAVTLSMLSRQTSLSMSSGGATEFSRLEEPQLPASFQIAQGGRPSRNWVPITMVVTDAAGQISQGPGEIFEHTKHADLRPRLPCRTTSPVTSFMPNFGRVNWSHRQG